MEQHARVLVVDDDRYDNDRYCQILSSAGYAVQGVADAEQAQQVIAQQRFDVVLLDMLLPMRLHGRLDFGGMEVLRRIKAYDDTIQVIAVTGYGSRELAAEAMAAGAIDYITKDPDTDDRLPGSVKVAAARAQILRASRQVAEDEESEVTLTTPNHLVADSAAMRQMLRRAQRLASIDSPMLIVGEPGVGKELIARVVHINSRYAAGPFVVVPCRTLSRDLVELWGETMQIGAAEHLHHSDVYSRYERGLVVLLNRIGPDHTRHSEILVFQQRLTENISRSRRNGDTAEHRAERTIIIDGLNGLASAELRTSFNQLCDAKPAGFCAQADCGTLLLKGIHDLPFNQQKQLVSFVERKEYWPVGAQQPVQGNLRIIATTTADLGQRVRQGRFWRALYDALNVATLDVPPLRERRDKDDILAIAGYLLHQYDLAPGISPEAAALLAAHDYAQGNIKELEEILRCAAAQANGGVIQHAHLPRELHGAGSGA